MTDQLPTVSGFRTATNMRQKLSGRETLGTKHITAWTALDIKCSCYIRSSTPPTQKLNEQCILRFCSKNFTPLLFQNCSHSRTKTDHIPYVPDVAGTYGLVLGGCYTSVASTDRDSRHSSGNCKSNESYKFCVASTKLIPQCVWIYDLTWRLVFRTRI